MVNRESFSRAKKSASEHYNAALGAILLLVVAVTLLIGLPSFIDPESAVGLTVTVVCGVTALLATLVLTTFILSCLGLSNRDEALGLPTGSVRAIIALSLILIFSILSIFMFQYMDDPVVTTTINTVTTNNSTIGQEIITNQTDVIKGTSQAVVDFSKQTLTTVGTLVVAIAAFYFGTRSVQVAQGSTEKTELFIDPSGTKELVIDSDNKLTPLTILIKPTPDDAAVSYKVVDDEYKSLQRESSNRYIYTPTTAEAKDVTLTFEMPAYSDVAAKELKVKIVKPELSIEPSTDKEITKGASISFEAKPSPKDTDVECTLAGDDKGSVKQDPKNKFTYTSAIDEGKEATLTFKMSKYPNVAAKELKVKIVKK